MRKGTVIVLAIALVAIVAGFVAYGRSNAGQAQLRYPVETKDVPLTAPTTTESSATLFANQRVVVQAGVDGLEVQYTYFVEHWDGGRMVSRTQIRPVGKPASEVISQPTTQVIDVGTRSGKAVQVAASIQQGQVIGRIGSAGTLRFEIEGKVTFAGDLSQCGPYGNPTFKYYQHPYRADVAPGSALFSVAGGRWIALRELKKTGTAFFVPGRKGQSVTCVVNDSPGYFADNRGAFEVIISR